MIVSLIIFSNVFVGKAYCKFEIENLQNSIYLKTAQGLKLEVNPYDFLIYPNISSDKNSNSTETFDINAQIKKIGHKQVSEMFESYIQTGIIQKKVNINSSYYIIIEKSFEFLRQAIINISEDIKNIEDFKNVNEIKLVSVISFPDQKYGRPIIILGEFANGFIPITVYKPRLGIQEKLLCGKDKLNKSDRSIFEIFDLPTYKIKSIEDGLNSRIYVDFIPDTTSIHRKSLGLKCKILHQLGRLLFLSPVFGIGDLHCGNLFINKEGIYLIDGEILGNCHYLNYVNEAFFDDFLDWGNFGFNKCVTKCYTTKQAIPGVNINISGKDKILRLVNNGNSTDEKVMKNNLSIIKKGYDFAYKKFCENFCDYNVIYELFEKISYRRFVPISSAVFLDYGWKYFNDCKNKQQIGNKCVEYVEKFLFDKKYLTLLGNEWLDEKILKEEILSCLNNLTVPNFSMDINSKSTIFKINERIFAVNNDLNITNVLNQVKNFLLNKENFKKSIINY